MNFQSLEIFLHHLVDTKQPIEHIDSVKALFERRFTLKDCLPEKPAKTFYQWTKEGLIPAFFGLPKLSFSFGTKTNSHKSWNRYHIFEFVWVRMVYYLREQGYSKFNIKKSNEEFFNLPSENLLTTLNTQLIKSESLIQHHISISKKNISPKSLNHELQKIIMVLSEIVFITEFHLSIYAHLFNGINLSFYANHKGISFKSGAKLNIELSSIHPFMVVPFDLIFNDLISVLELDTAKMIFTSNLHEIQNLTNRRELLILIKDLNKSNTIDDMRDTNMMEFNIEALAQEWLVLKGSGKTGRNPILYFSDS